MFKRNLFEFVDKKNLSWKDAIRLGTIQLEKYDYCTSELSEKIIETTLKYGPYYIISPLIALAHTEAGSYCKKEGMSFTFFKKVIHFSGQKEHKVKTLFTLSIVDSESHLEYLKRFVNIMSNDDFRKKMLNCKTKSDVEKLFADRWS